MCIIPHFCVTFVQWHPAITFLVTSFGSAGPMKGLIETVYLLPACCVHTVWLTQLLHYIWCAMAESGTSGEMHFQEVQFDIAAVITPVAQWEGVGTCKLDVRRLDPRHWGFGARCSLVPPFWYFYDCHVLLHVCLRTRSYLNQLMHVSPYLAITPFRQRSWSMGAFALTSLFGYRQPFALNKTMKPSSWRLEASHNTSFFHSNATACFFLLEPTLLWSAIWYPFPLLPGTVGSMDLSDNFEMSFYIVLMLALPCCCPCAFE